MAFAIWDPALLTGNPLIDEQHKRLFILVNQLHDAILKSAAHSVLADTLNQLIEYTATHFKDEEDFWRLNNYPFLQEHITEHEKLTAQSLEIQNKFLAGQMALTLQLSQFLKDWLNHHIKGDDKRAIDYLREHNII